MTVYIVIQTDDEGWPKVRAVHTDRDAAHAIADDDGWVEEWEVQE